ncbi:haloacid dehalogenase-like hydrolase [Pseudonocardia eucalypti]|uniref:Haloacid dehalogenase-like hydrolase n=1 Tax=Pseudonocardia eucalypti TaxID=648755 RepID=A0ABP9QNA1_9PSEU
MLWDIDHTLIETRGVGFAIYQRAFRASTGHPLQQLAQVAGRTELDIMRETLRINGIEPTSEAVTSLARALTQGYDEARNELASTGRALPGAARTLSLLADQPTVHQGVLTGNLEDVARIKLDVFDLTKYLDLHTSAYGNDHTERADLVKIAQERARTRLNATFSNSHTVLLGDTPNDIHAAISAGVRSIGVATGKSSVEDLKHAGAHGVLPDLGNLATATELIFAVADQS